MKISPSIFAALMAGSVMATSALASDKAMQMQVDALTERLSELEQRLNTIEKKPTMVTRTTIIKTDNSLPPPTNPGEWQDTANWIHIKVGMDYQDVRDLLGEPIKIRRGASEFWYYTEQKFDGPHLKFLFKKVHAWKAPEGIAGTD
ncbi:MAG: hypothetical protein COB33_010680 [Thiotrichaceae bacterium]|nr:hypothetical protein [Thiotrichaceae bacterium]